ncbi:hypothetical protein GRI40_02685 [Altererythrobacter aerius]|uniref:Lipoprotein n=1 Tax=Tsuneonella aeria TaxID=1837929 RepID=A0A6I4TBT9_9SPHN|nr:hypothetical protein [Tsuneonella aeria]MXO74127.1 hypothetical protein [Tsuneonella aeria]
MIRAAALIALAGLAACSEPADQKAESADDFAQRAGVGGAAAGAPAVAEINAQPLAAPTGKALLTPLARNAPTALGEIHGGCSYIYQGRSLLVVGAPDTTDATGKGVLVIDGQQVVLPGAAAGGPQVVESGPTLSGNGYTVAVLRADGAPRSVSGRNEWAADLVVTGPTGETTFSPGTWNCTP